MHDQGLPSETAAGADSAPLPAGSRMEIVEASPDRMLLLLRGGSGGLGCLAIIWNGILAVFTPLIIAGGGPQGPPKGWTPTLVFGLFWLIGLGLGWAALRMRFERILLLIEPRRLAIQRSMFGRTRSEELDVGADGRVEFEEAYTQNDVPVHRLVVTDSGGALRFGTALPEPDKHWLREELRRRLGLISAKGSPDSGGRRNRCTACGALFPPIVPRGRLSQGDAEEFSDDDEFLDAVADEELESALPRTCPECGQIEDVSSSASAWSAPLEQDDAPPESPFPDEIIRVEQDDFEVLAFSTPVAGAGSVARKIGGALGCLSLLILAGVGAALFAAIAGGGAAPIPVWIVFTLPFLVFAVGLGLLALFLRRGRVRVQVDRDVIQSSTGVGPFVHRRSAPMVLVERIDNSTIFGTLNTGARRDGGPVDTQRRPVARAKSGAVWLVLSGWHSPDVAAHCAQLVRKRLEQLGVRIPETRGGRDVAATDDETRIDDEWANDDEPIGDEERIGDEEWTDHNGRQGDDSSSSQGERD